MSKIKDRVLYFLYNKNNAVVECFDTEKEVRDFLEDKNFKEVRDIVGDMNLDKYTITRLQETVVEVK